MLTALRFWVAYTWMLLYPWVVEEEPASRKLPGWAIALIIVGGLIILLPICTICLLSLLGPAIGEVFSDIIQDLE